MEEKGKTNTPKYCEKCSKLVKNNQNNKYRT